mmetsp:Transcript_72362/g.234133  ORF Transcript_72362/g.234133 Transcript_72362/m.234133 type:complete len:280 (-) Transcript_72362:77-916(-)
MAFTCCLTASSLSSAVGITSSAPSGPARASKESRSLGIWYRMKSCISSCVSLISFVRLSSGRLRTLSSCGLICTTRTPKSVLSSCMDRKAFAKSCCSGDSDSMASLNSFGVGIVERSRGMVSSSLFCTMAACLGSNVRAEVMRPTSTSMELNCLALATSCRLSPDSPENWCDSQAWRYLSPPKETFVEAFRGKYIGCSWLLRATRVGTGPGAPPVACSMLTVPSGLCRSERRTAKQKGAGAKASAKSLRLWKRMYSEKSAGVTSLPIAATSCFRSMPSM